MGANDKLAAALHGADRFDVDDDGWGGYLEVDPAETLEWDGAQLPAVTWHMPLYRAEVLARALTAVDWIAGALGEHHEEQPVGWDAELVALRAGLDRLVEQGRAHRLPDDGHLVAGPARACRVCGCTDGRACVGPVGRRCHWVEADLCSACAS